MHTHDAILGLTDDDGMMLGQTLSEQGVYFDVQVQCLNTEKRSAKGLFFLCLTDGEILDIQFEPEGVESRVAKGDTGCIV